MHKFEAHSQQNPKYYEEKEFLEEEDEDKPNPDEENEE